MATYTAQTRTLTARPRSERLRQTVGSGMVVGGGTGSAFGSYLPASENGNGYDVNHKTSFVQNIRLGNPDTVVDGETVVNGIDIEFDSATGAVHIKGGLYADWVSAMGANDSSSGSGGGGLDESALWELLNGTSTPEYTGSKIISSSYLPSIALSSTYGTLPVNRGGTGATTAADALENLIGSSSIGGNYPIYWTGSSFSQLTGTLSNNITGKVNGCTISSTVNSGTADYLTYYSGANTISNTSANKKYYIGGPLHLSGNITTTAHSGGNSSISIKSADSTNIAFIGSGSSTPVSGGEYGIVQLFQNGTEMHRLYAQASSNSWVCYGAGNFGIGTNSPSYKLDVSGVIRATDAIFGYAYSKSNNMAAFIFDKPGSNYTGIGAIGVSDTIHFGPCTIAGAWVSNYNQNWEFQGNVYALGGVTALASVSSDKRLKKDIKPFNAMEIVDKLNPVKFRWNKHAHEYNHNFNNGVNYGLIAQDCDGIIDDMVFDLPDGSGYKGVRYEKLIPVLLQAIKELKLMVKELKGE